MLRLVRYRRRLVGVANLRAYLFTLARNEVARHFGRKRPEPSVPDVGTLELPADDPEPEALRALRDALARLSPERREVVTRKVYDRLTFAEIGAELSISPNTAASRYRYALADLRKMLEAEDGTRAR
jgi:RNA polymerase sigma-70 factor (ECF subfamily)